VSLRLRYLLDTNVISETRKNQANPNVLSFLSVADPSSLFLSVLTIGELRKGVAIKKRRDVPNAKKLGAWVDGLESTFTDHILDIDAITAKLWGELSAQRTRPVIDTLLAATALAHGLILVTRNTNDVSDTKVKLLNPWE
jgi:predicted nucleic acid-binding protein